MPNPGALSGLTVLRFAHAFESGGGTERYLDDLDRALLDRNAMTIVRLHLARDAAAEHRVEEKLGQGRLVRFPLAVRPGAGSAANDEHSLRFRLKQKTRNWILYNPLLWHLGAAQWTASRPLPPQPGQAVGAGAAAADAIRTNRINLAMLHFFGGADAEEVMGEVRRAGIPFALLNHYANDRFLHLAIRKHAMLADGVAGVNGLDVPRYLRNRFTNLSDGIDPAFFRRAHARPLAKPPAGPVVLLPARVVREKGQLDLVRAVASLRRTGLECGIAFAGRSDSSGFAAELHREIAAAEMTECVRFLGALTVEELRDWYAASAIVALPTYHHEGLPRVVLEAQAMEVPIVAYASGGVADGIVPGRTGFLLRTGDISGLADRLRTLLASPDLRATFAAHGRQAAESRFSVSALAERHEQFYARIIAGSQGAPIHANGG